MKGGASRGEGRPGERDWDSFKESCEGWLCGELINSRRGESGGSVKTHGIKTIYVLDTWRKRAACFQFLGKWGRGRSRRVPVMTEEITGSIRNQQ